MWEVINEATNTATKKVSIDCIKINNILISDEQDIADSFNDFFDKIGPETAEKVHPTGANFKDYLTPTHPPNSLFMQLVDANAIIETFRDMEKKLRKT